MPSSIQFTSTVTARPTTTSIYTRPAKKQKMSITQTYFLAHSARGKLSKEASRADHDLRLLVGHANMLDHLMIDLANAEREQERWFNKSVSGASEPEEEHVKVDTIVEEPAADWEAEDADTSEDDDDDDDDSTYDEETSSVISSAEVDSDMEIDTETDSELALTRTPSRHSPPELSHDSDSDSEDEQMPPSPPQPAIAAFSEKQRQAIATTSFYDNKDATLSDQDQQALDQGGYFLPTRDQPNLVAAY